MGAQRPSRQSRRPSSADPGDAAPPAAQPGLAFQPRRDVPLLAGLLIVTLAAMWPVAHAQFLTWDDRITVQQNPWLRAPAADALAHFWSQPDMHLYIPVTYSAWMAIASGAQSPGSAIGALDPAVFHVANLAVHALAVMIVYFLLRRMTAPIPSALGALLFAAHPLQVEPVAWVSGLKDVLCGLLALAALLAYPIGWRAMEQTTSRKYYARYAVATLLFILAVLTKPVAMVLPGMVLACLWARGQLRRATLPRLGPWLLISLACITWTQYCQTASTVESPLWLRPLIAGHALAMYLWKLLVPLRLAVDYGYSPAWLRQHAWAWPAAVAPVAVGVFLWILRSKIRWVILGVVLFLLPLTPVLGLIPFDFQIYSTVADHYLYLPMFGVAVIVAQAASRLKPAVALAAIAVLAPALGIGARMQTQHWRDNQTLFTHTLEVNPDSLAALITMVRSELDAGRLDQAEQYARRAVQAHPNDPNSLAALGTVYARQKRPELAQQQYFKALERDPQCISAVLHLGILLAEHGQLDEARRYFNTAAQLDPRDAKARLNLGTVLAQLNHPAEAAQELQLAVQLDPSDVQARVNLAIVLAGMGDLAGAAREFTIALKLDPASAGAQQGLRAVREAMQKRH